MNSMNEVEIEIATYHILGVLDSAILLIFSVMPEKDGLPRMGDASFTTVASAVFIDVLTTTFFL